MYILHERFYPQSVFQMKTLRLTSKTVTPNPLIASCQKLWWEAFSNLQFQWLSA